MGSRLTRFLIGAPPSLFLLTFFLAPSLIMVGASFRHPGEFGGLAPLVAPASGDHGVTLDAYAFLFGDWIYLWICVKSFFIAAATTMACLLLAYPLAMLIARSPRKHRDFLVLLVILPFASNFLIRVYAWMIVLGPLDLLYTQSAVLIALVYVHLPFMILPLYINLEKHDPVLLDAAQDLGANAWQRFWRVTFPLSLPGIFAGSALVFIPVLGMFAIPELLGGTRDILIGNLIKEQFLDNRDWPLGSALSLVLTAMVLALAWLTLRFARARTRGIV